MGTLSKAVSPGLRLGWLVGPEPVIRRLADIKMQTDYGSSAFSQEIVAHWMMSGRYDRHVERLRTRLQERAERMEKGIDSIVDISKLPPPALEGFTSEDGSTMIVPMNLEKGLGNDEYSTIIDMASEIGNESPYCSHTIIHDDF